MQGRLPSPFTSILTLCYVHMHKQMPGGHLKKRLGMSESKGNSNFKNPDVLQRSLQPDRCQGDVVQAVSTTEH